MAEQQSAHDAYKASLAAVIDGIKQLDAVGVEKNKAAEMATSLFINAEQSARYSAHSSPPPTGAAPGRADGSDHNLGTDKGAVIRAFKNDVARLGITEDDMATHFGDFERRSPTAGNGNGDTAPITEQTREARTETADRSEDATTPAGGPPNEPMTGAPPAVEPGTGPHERPTNEQPDASQGNPTNQGKPAKPVKPKAGH